MTEGYGEAAPLYLELGWPGVLPLPAGMKEAPPTGFTGKDGADPDTEQVVEWMVTRRDGNVALRLPHGVIGIDVDQYDHKDGARRLEAFRAEHGLPPLPPTWTSSAREGESGIRFYRVPEGSAELRDPVLFVELIRHDHRYAIVWPSIHPEGGQYRWRDPDDEWTDEIPSPDDLPLLPSSWIIALSARKHEPAQASCSPGPTRDLDPYVQRAVEAETSAVLAAVEGERNNQLNRSTFALATLISVDAISEGEVLDTMEAVGRAAGLEPGEVQKTVWSAIDAGKQKPRDWPPPGRMQEPLTNLDGSDYIDPAGFFTKDGPMVADMATYVKAMGGPIAWGLDGNSWSYQDGVWRHDPKVVARRVVALLGNRYRHSHMTNVADIVEAQAEVIRCDPVPSHINFRNGMLDWETGELEPHDPSWHSTVQLPHEWDPTATCPQFDTFLAEVLHPDFIGLAWEMIGYLMYSGNPLQVAFLFTGKGSNGKGTLLRVIERLVGTENCSSVDPVEINENRFAAASMFGMIANIVGDIDPTYQTSTAMFKKITGEDTVRLERKYGTPTRFAPWAVPLFSANEIPGSADTTDGYVRRWVVLHFGQRFEGGQKDIHLSQRLYTEVEGIAVKALPALRRLMERGHFDIQGEAQATKEAFVAQIDQVHQWMNETVIVDPEGKAERKACYDSYKAWAEDNGVGRLGKMKFNERLRAMGFHDAPSNGQHWWSGFRLVALGPTGNLINHLAPDSELPKAWRRQQ